MSPNVKDWQLMISTKFREKKVDASKSCVVLLPPKYPPLLSLSISSFHSNTTYSFPSGLFLPHLSFFLSLSLKLTALSTFVLCKRCMSQFLVDNIVLSGAILEYRKKIRKKINDKQALNHRTTNKNSLVHSWNWNIRNTCNRVCQYVKHRLVSSMWVTAFIELSLRFTKFQ